MDDLDRQFPYPRYLKVPFIFLADGEPEPPEWAQFKRDYPGWVVFRGWFVPEPPTALDAEPEQHHVAHSQSMTEAEAEADYWAHRNSQSGHGGEAGPAPWPNTDIVPSVLLNPMGNSDARLGHRPARINGTELWTSEGLSAAMHASAAHITAYHGDVDAALAAAKAASSPDIYHDTDTIRRSPVPPLRPKANRSLPPVQLWAAAATSTSHATPLLRLVADDLPEFDSEKENLNEPGDEEDDAAKLIQREEDKLRRELDSFEEFLPFAGVVADIKGAGAAVPAPKTIATKPPLPRAQSEVRGVRRFNPENVSHVNAAITETQLALAVHNVPDQQVIRWGDPIGSHGADVISVNTKTGEVTLWDAKYRGDTVTIRQSSTFTRKSARAKAIKQAIQTLEKDTTLSPETRHEALGNLRRGRLRTATVGFGGVRNSVVGN